ncbi:MAG TPA: hypothetical protein VFN43_03335 [Humibacillus sp.]|nr:hypothetical protein [Humibacillus sp.]
MIATDRLPAGAAQHVGGREMVWLGVAGDTAAPVCVDVSGAAGRLLVVGPPRSGRSNVLVVAARQLTAYGRDIAVITGRRSPLKSMITERGMHVLSPHDDRRFVELRRAHPELAVLVDDLEAVEGSELERALAECVGLVDESQGLVWATADTARANAAFRGLVPGLARHGTGLVLCPGAPTDGDCLQARPEPTGRAIPGRGSLVVDSRCLPIQIARADSCPGPGRLDAEPQDAVGRRPA